MSSRPRRLRWAAALAAGTLIVGCRGGGTAGDLLVITLDTTRADHLGSYGADAAATPTLDRLAAGAIQFDQAVAPVPVTLPSHSTMFTGFDPYRHGVRYNLMYVLSDEQTTLAERLSEAGFRTGAVVSSFVISERFGLAQGFETYHDIGQIATGKTFDEQPERRAGDSVDLAIEWWNEHRGERRFLWLHLYDPHFDYRPPFPFSAEYTDRPYAGEIAYVDRELGRLFDALREAGDWQDSLIVVAGDHGEGLYEHGEPWHADLVYQSTMHPPLIVKPPRWSRARRVAEPVGLVDLTPTVLDYAGLPVPHDLDGISLRGAVRRGRAPVRAIYFESLTDNLTYGWSALRGVRYGRWKYLEGARRELYDLQDDPGETINLVDSEPEWAADLAEELRGFRQRESESADADAAASLDEDSLARLAALGYVALGGIEPTEIEAAVHPPDLIDLTPELVRAQGLVSRSNWEAAAERLDFILRRDPRNRAALHSRAVVFMAEARFDDALKLAETLVQLYPGAARARDLRAHLLSRLGRPLEAAQVLAEALEMHPHNAQLRYHRFLALMEAGRQQQAAAELTELEQRRPDDFTTAVSRAMLEAAEGRTDGSLQALERAVALGLKNFKPMDESSLFAEVRKRPEYRALKRSAEEDADAAGTPAAAKSSLPG